MLKPSTQDVSYLVASIALLLLMSVVFYVAIFDTQCYKYGTPTYDQFLNGLNSNYTFKQSIFRTMASKIYEYRLANEYKPQQDMYVSIFMAKNSSAAPPNAMQLSDVCLHKLCTAPTGRFSALVPYIPIFNNGRYVECIKS